ncbi:MAG: hypothetical protein ACI4VF_05290 [Lachnospirales bacterium]
MTNAEMLVKSLQDGIDGNDKAFDYVEDYIACPYIYNPNCGFDGLDAGLCTGCKREWLEREWKE